MKQRITEVQKEIVYEGQKMKTDNGCNEPTEKFSGCAFGFTDNSRCFFPFPNEMKEMGKNNLCVYLFILQLMFSHSYGKTTAFHLTTIILCHDKSSELLWTRMNEYHLHLK